MSTLTCFFAHAQNKILGKYSPASLTSVLGQVTEQIIPSAIMQHVRDSWEIRPSQPGVMKGRSCLMNPISLYKVTLSG